MLQDCTHQRIREDGLVWCSALPVHELLTQPKQKATATMKQKQEICNHGTHVDLHALDGKRLDLRRLVRHIAVELVPSLVPLDRVQHVAAQVVAARQVRSLALLQELGDPHREVRQAVDHCKIAEKSIKISL